MTGGGNVVAFFATGGDAFGVVFLWGRKSSAARAALRGASPLPHLFRANHSWGIGARPLGAYLNIESGQQGGRAPPSQA